ncbi:hypothetical protein EV182_000719 [Spiromyces aspiralis]|uniref:Uncharacterized protein n=1 Tax=Spiromyces aspiralis TaxID=68401 RepID=A0ACC1HXN4_9FUNG|nr:hypothetical protein EV182_000719 [Spiromyces aspiralis]
MSTHHTLLEGYDGMCFDRRGSSPLVPYVTSAPPSAHYQTLLDGSPDEIAQQLSLIGITLSKRTPSGKALTKCTRPPNSFILYRSDKARELAALHPEFSQSDISRRVSLMWKSESEEVKAKYRQYQDVVKQRYQALINQHGCGGEAVSTLFYTRNRNRQRKGRAHHQLSCSDGASVPDEVSSPHDATKRPMNTFIRYRNHVMDRLSRAGFFFNQTELSKISSKLWERELPCVRERFRQEYLDEKQKFDATSATLTCNSSAMSLSPSPSYSSFEGNLAISTPHRYYGSISSVPHSAPPNPASIGRHYSLPSLQLKDPSSPPARFHPYSTAIKNSPIRQYHLDASPLTLYATSPGLSLEKYCLSSSSNTGFSKPCNSQRLASTQLSPIHIPSLCGDKRRRLDSQPGSVDFMLCSPLSPTTPVAL